MVIKVFSSGILLLILAKCQMKMWGGLVMSIAPIS